MAAETSTPLVIGHWNPNLQHDAAAALQEARTDGFDYVTTSLSVPRRTDVTQLETRWWRTSVVGVLETIDQWEERMEWAWHMSLPAVILPPLPTTNASAEITEYAQFIQALAHAAIQEAGMSFQVWIPVYPAQLEWWQLIRMHVTEPNVGVLLQLPHPLTTNSTIPDPSVYVAEQLQSLHNYIGCGPLLAVQLSTSVFLTNKGGFPTLSKLHQWLVEVALQRVGRTVRWLLHNDTSAAPGRFGEYLRHVRNRPVVSQVLDTGSSIAEADYLDALQKPLQPLKDHLLSATYETFERDPVKYESYQRASQLALRDLARLTTCHVIVVGAGRGPLVTGVLKAYAGLPHDQRPSQLNVIAVEKNPSAVIYLQAKLQTDQLWKEASACLSVLQADLRSLPTDLCQSTDIVVSELLGSFGCNELSPECLHTLMRRCRANCISIPSRYISYVAPVSSVHVHHQIIHQQAFFPDISNGVIMGRQRAVETPYVVRPHAASQVTAAQAAWSFEHPSLDEDNLTRCANLRFHETQTGLSSHCGYGPLDLKTSSLSKLERNQPWIVTGFLGTFSAILYKNVQIATRPEDYSTGMFSWFPLYFPLNEPIFIPQGGSIEVNLWRKLKGNRVWYEWGAVYRKDDQLLGATAIHNPQGRSYYVDLS